MANAINLIGLGMPAALANEVANQLTPTPEAAIADVTVTGTYATDDDAIETAINSILAVLRTNGFIDEV